MKATRRVEGEWIAETPESLLRWMWAHDGTEAVVIDGNKRYCGTEETAAKFRTAWAKEHRKGDKRTATMFIDLAPILHASEPMPTTSSALCAFTGKYCSETPCAETCELPL